MRATVSIICRSMAIECSRLRPSVNADGGAVDMTQGPDGALYYCELIGGRVMRIRHGEDAGQLIQIGGIDFSEEDDGDDGDDIDPDEIAPSDTCRRACRSSLC
jgi:hypothetical protein